MSKAVKSIETGIMSCPLLPENWEIKKLKYLAKVQTGRTPSIQGAKVDFFENGDINWFTPADFGNERYLDNSSRKVNQLALDNGEIQLFPNHSIYLVSIGATLGKIGISEKSGSANQQINVISFYEDINPVFGFYFLKSISSNLINEVDFTTLPILNQTKTKDIFIPLPSIETQEIIAAFLDQKTAEIDSLISKKQKLIECLKEERMAIINQAVTKGINQNAEMKESGIDWLGQIPKHWEVKKLKYVVSKVGSGVTPTGGATVYQQVGIPLIRSQNIYNDGIRLDDIAYISEDIDNSMSNSRVFAGDVLLNITGASIGRCFYIKETFGQGNVNQHVCIIRPINSHIQTIYLHLLMISKIGQIQIDLQQTGANREGLNFEQLNKFLLPIPLFSEQTQIVSYIESQTQRIDTTISKIEQEIDLIKEYRTSLINEVVTGKMILN